MRVLRTIIEPLILTMFDTRQELGFGCPVALELISNEHAGNILQSLEQLAKEALGGDLIAAGLYENIQHYAVLIDSTPEIARLAINFHEDLIQVPFVARPGPT